MTIEQQRLIAKARDLIKETRQLLDSVMYYTDPHLPEGEFEKVRKAYDAICAGNDLLP